MRAIDRAVLIHRLSRASIERLPRQDAELRERLDWRDEWLRGRPEAAATSRLVGPGPQGQAAGSIG